MSSGHTGRTMLRSDVAAIAFTFAGILLVGEWLEAAPWLLSQRGDLWPRALSLVSLGFGVGIIARARWLADRLFPEAAGADLDAAPAEAWFAVGLGLLGLYLIATQLPILLSATWFPLGDAPMPPGSTVPPPTPTCDPLCTAIQRAMVDAVAGVGLGAVLLLTRNALAELLAQQRRQLSRRATTRIWLAVGALVALWFFTGRR